MRFDKLHWVGLNESKVKPINFVDITNGKRKMVVFENIVDEKSKKTDNRGDNHKFGSMFEAAVVLCLNNNGAIQYRGTIDNGVMEDAQRCASEISNRFGKIVTARQCGRNSNVTAGDIVIQTEDNPEIKLEMKYIQNHGMGTWHNSSVNLFKNVVDDRFMSIQEALNVKIADMGLEQDSFTISKGLSFKLNPENTMLQTLEDLYEPFMEMDGVDDDILENIEPSDANSPLGHSSKNTWDKIYDLVMLSKNKNGVVEYRELDDDEYGQVAAESEEGFRENDLQSSYSWEISGKNAVVSPALVFNNVLQPLGKQFLGYIGRMHIGLIKGDGELPTKILSVLCDKVESSGRLSEKRPDFLVVYSTTKKKTAIFDCANYKSGNSDSIEFDDRTENRYFIGNESVGFSVQYYWKNGGFSHPALSAQFSPNKSI